MRTLSNDVDPEEDDRDQSVYIISCDLCEADIGTEQPNAHGTPTNNLSDAVITIETGVNNIDICPKCRYAGATVEMLQWTLKPNKFSVDIIGALKSTLRICDNMQQYIGDLRIQIDNNDKAAMFKTITNIENLVSMARTNDNVAISELMEFGK